MWAGEGGGAPTRRTECVRYRQASADTAGDKRGVSLHRREGISLLYAAGSYPQEKSASAGRIRCRRGRRSPMTHVAPVNRKKNICALPIFRPTTTRSAVHAMSVDGRM